MKKQLHIAVMSPLYKDGGGIETWLIYFLKGILSRKIYSKIYIYHIKPLDYKKSISCMYKYHENCKFMETDLKEEIKKGRGINNIFKYTKLTLKLMKLKVQLNDDILIIGSVLTAPVGILCKILFRKNKLITWIRSRTIGELAARRSRFLLVASLIERILLRLSDIIITNGKDTMDYYQKNFPKYASKIFVIENAVNYENFSTIDIPNFNKRMLSIAYLGRMIAAKGFPEFVKVAQYFDKKEVFLKFNVHGHGREVDLLDKSIGYNGAYSPNDINRILSCYDVIVFLNKAESAGGLSHGLLEAMAAGRLIVAWDNVIHNQVLTTQNSILVPEGEINGLIKVFKLLNTDRKKTIKCLENKCRNARKMAREFSIENHIDKYIKLVSLTN